MLIRSQNQLGLVNLDNVAYLHIVNGNILEGNSSKEWRIQARVAISNQEVILGEYPSEKACTYVMNAIQDAYLDSSVIAINMNVSTRCFPKATVFNMPPASDYETGDAEKESADDEKEEIS